MLVRTGCFKGFSKYLHVENVVGGIILIQLYKTVRKLEWLSLLHRIVQEETMFASCFVFCVSFKVFVEVSSHLAEFSSGSTAYCL